MERLEELRSKYPEIYRKRGMKVNRNRLVNQTTLFEKDTRDFKDDFNAWVDFFSKLKDKYPQFDSIEMHVEGYDERANIGAVGYMKETDEQYEARIQTEEEQVELLALVAEEEKIQREKQNIEQYAALHRRYGGVAPDKLML